MPEELKIIEDNSLYTKYAILTVSEYYKLNEVISKAKGYKLEDHTARYSSMNPAQCKVNIRYEDEVELYDTMCVMVISTELQENYPELLPTLVDKYVTENNLTKTIEVDNTVDVDWVLQHYERVGSAIDLIKINKVRTNASNKATDSMVGNGITIMTVDDNSLVGRKTKVLKNTNIMVLNALGETVISEKADRNYLVETKYALD